MTGMTVKSTDDDASAVGHSHLWRPIGLLAWSVVALLFLPGKVQACTCAGFGTIGDAFASAERVVLGRVEGRREIPADRADGIVSIFPDAVVVKVLKVLKGSAPDEVLISTEYMCYATFYVDGFKPGETYVFPIIQTNSRGVGVLPVCGHSALKLVDGQLYTNEPTGDGNRLAPYMSLALARVLIPLGLLDPRGQFVFGSGVALLACLAITWVVRRQGVRGASAESRDGPVSSLKTLRWSGRFAVAWMLLSAGVCVLFGVNTWDWLPWTLGILFAFAAAGIAVRWRWTEGLAYGLTLVGIGACAMLSYEAVKWFFASEEDIHYDRIYYVLALAVVWVAATVWCAIAVKRRFSGATE